MTSNKKLKAIVLKIRFVSVELKSIKCRILTLHEPIEAEALIQVLTSSCN